MGLDLFNWGSLWVRFIMSPFRFLGPPVLVVAHRPVGLMGLYEGWYIYVDSLRRLSSSLPSTPSTLVNAQPPPSPINLDCLALYLLEYPDQQL